MVGFPVFYLLFTALIFELNSKGVLALVLSPLYYLASIFWVMTGFGFRKMRQWSWYTLWFAQLFVFYLNALSLVNYSRSETKVQAFVLTLLIQFYVFFAASREVRVPYLFPRIKWWESGIAGMTHIRVEIETTHSEKSAHPEPSLGQILDINLRGCFLKTPRDFHEFEKIKMRGNFYGTPLELPGTIVWLAQSTVTHPKGVGVKFYGLDGLRKKHLKGAIKQFLKERESSGVIPAQTG